MRRYHLFVSQDNNSYFQIYIFISSVNPFGTWNINHRHHETTRFYDTHLERINIDAMLITITK